MTFFISPPKNWGNLEGIPTDLTDGKITWGEVIEKPSAFPPESIPLESSQAFSVQGLEFKYTDGVNKNTKNSNSISGLTTSGGTLLEAVSQGNLILGIRPNQAFDGFAIVFTDIQPSPLDALYTLAKILIVRGQIKLDAASLILTNLPTSSTGAGLPSGTVYRDSNNFLKIVP